MLFRLLLSVSLALALGACSSAYYGTLEKFGIEKRDILVDRVEDASDAQDDAKEQFNDALEQFRSVVVVDGGELESTYDRLKSEYDACEAEAEAVSGRISAVEKVAEDLFAEWEDELALYQDAKLKAASRSQLRETQQKYRRLLAAMHRAEGRMDPVLKVFRDHVLYLKHNLNARAIASLKNELGGIEGDVDRLVQAMDQAIQEAQQFIGDIKGA
jgi:hypothetical protein